MGASAPRYPVISTATATSRGLTLAAGASLTLSGGMLDLKGNFANNGTLTNPAGMLNLSGSAMQTIGGSAASMFHDLTVGSLGANLAGPVAVQRGLMLNGNLSTEGQPFTLLSNATGTAMVVNNGGVVTGQATVQRYVDPSLNAGLGYRHYSAPVGNTTVADLATSGFTPVLNPAYNTSATPGTLTPFPNVFGYDESRVGTVASNYSAFDQGYFSPASPDATLTPGRGYTVNIGATQTVDFNGTLTTGTLAPLALGRNTGPSAAAAGWHLVGNPYPAPLDYSLVAAGDRANLDAAVYVYESNSQYGGNYRTLLPGFTPNAVLASAQGFFVHTTTSGTDGSLTFRNSQRVTDFTAPTTFRRGTANTLPQVQLALQGATGPADVLTVYATPQATANVDAEYDAVKLTNPSGLNLAALAPAGTALAINGLPAITSATVVPLSLGLPAAGTYTLRADTLSNLPATVDAYLVDLLTGQQVNLRQQRSLSVTLSAAQVAQPLLGRFVLRFAAATALATKGSLTAADVTVYPNPSRGSFRVLLPAVQGATQAQATLLNALGQQVWQDTVALSPAGTSFPVEATSLASGVYTLRVQAGATTVARRVVVE